MTAYYDDGNGIVIYHGDCRDVLPTIDPASVDLVLTDPPWGIGYDTWDESVPYDIIEAFPKSTIAWFGAPSRLCLDAATFVTPPQRTIMWVPRFTLLHTRQDGMAYRWRPIHVWRIPKQHDGPAWDVLDTPTECGNWWVHPCTKPVALMRSLTGFAPAGGVVLDPFMGSGTTLRAAKDLGRRATGIDLEERNCEIAAKRLQQSVLPWEVTS